MSEDANLSPTLFLMKRHGSRAIGPRASVTSCESIPCPWCGAECKDIEGSAACLTEL